MNQLLASTLAALPAATVGAFAPGRVNLIGEHTDYSGLPVLPFAIPLGLAVAAAERPWPAITVRSALPERYPAEVIPLAELQRRPRAGTWVDYVVAGLRLHPPPGGCELLVAGNLPAAAGLSSSSALVVASAMLFASDPMDRLGLAEQTRAAEHYVGTRSGGMDQATALLGQAGHALRITFRPLQARPIPVPAGLAVVVADSGVRADKGGAAQQAYNDRVQQCALAAAAMGALPGGLLADVPGAERERRARAIPDAVLAARAGFVFAEAARVDAAAAALAAGDLVALGALLDRSHAGLRDEYQVSHPAVDALVDVARAAGAAGARIVGAGFGGCCIALCRVERAEELARTLRQAGAADAFPVRPAGGAVRVTVTTG